MKICPRCKTEKPFSAFHMQGTRPSGLCRECNKAYCKEYGAKRYATDPAFVERERLRGERNRTDPSYRIVQIFHSVREGAKKRGIEFAIEKKHIADMLAAQNWTCARTGIPLDLTSGKGKRPFGPTVDRIDNARGYAPDNIQIVCIIYNFAKNEFKDDDVLRFAHALTENSIRQLQSRLRAA